MRRITLIIFFLLILIGCNNNNEKSFNTPLNIPFYKQDSLPHDEEVHLEALFEGNLVVNNGCLLLKHQNGFYNPIWPHSVSLAIFDNDLSIIKGNKVVLKVNESIKIGGGEIGTPKSLINKYQVPYKCQYKFWLVGEIL